MNQITVLSGKGGTGKTTITACFAALSSNSVFADCDVDASNLHLLLNPRITETIEFKGLKLAEIDPPSAVGAWSCASSTLYQTSKWTRSTAKAVWYV